MEALEPRLLLDGSVEPVIPLDMGFLGASIPSWWYNSYETTGAASLAALADTGANFVGLTPTWYQDTLASNAIASDANKTATDAGLIDMITGAQAEDMLVMLKPHVDVQTGAWRGNITPGDTDAWFASYEDFIVHYAEIAQTYGVELFVIGTELAALSGAGYEDEWTAVANAVYTVYGGTVTYAANDEEYQDVSFWDAVDYVALDAYFDLGLGAPAVDASYDDILAEWAPFVTEVGDWMATERAGQRAVIAEIGYRSIEGAHIQPWDSWRPGTLSEQAQADCYRAALEAWPGANYLDAMAFWAWPVNLADDVGGDELTTGYSPYGKAAEDVLREYTYRMYLPDLVTEIDVSPRTPLPGQTVTVQVTTRNIGSGPAAAADAADFQTMLFLRDAWSFDASYTADIVGQQAYTDIAPGGEQTFEVTFAAPLVPGRYHVGALADANENVFEDSEGNNLTAVDLWVNLAPVVTAPIGDLDIEVGAPPTVINLPDHLNDPDIIGSVYRFISNMGTFDALMFDEITPITPITVANFRAYADAGDYVDSIFHRSMPDFIIQSGGFAYTDAEGTGEWNMVDVINRGPTQNEPYRSNVRGTLAPAKIADQPNSASNGWFVNLADNGPNLDTQNSGFSPFAEIIGTGMDVADAIAALEIWNGEGAFGSAFGDLPLIDYIPGQSVVQDHFVYFSSISQVAPLAFEVVANTNPSLVTAAIGADGTMTLTCAPGLSGQARITVRATDLCGATVEETFDVVVGPVNNDPAVWPDAAWASSEFSPCLAEKLIDGSGLSGDSHGTDYRDMWLSSGVASPTLKLDLGQVHLVTGLHVWNYNQVSGAALTGRGFRTADVYVSTTGDGNPTDNSGDWTLVAENLAFVEATGQADYAGRSYMLDADGIEARWVFFDDVTNWDGKAYTGLSEVQIRHLGTVAVPETVTPTNATASSALPSALPDRLIDGSGLDGASHGTDYRDMWLSSGVPSPTLKLDLGQPHLVTGLHVWNYNQVSGAALTGRGFCTADVYVSTTGMGNPTDNSDEWTLVADDLAFVEATGQADDVGRSYVLDADGIEARWVFFDNVTNWNGEAYTGLSEIRVEHLGAIAVPQTVTPTNATASSALPSALPGRLIDGSGLSGGSHGTDYRDMWLSNGVASPTLKLDLGQPHLVTGLHVWNYNQVSGAALTGRGFCTADVYVSTTGMGNPTDNSDEWTLVADDLAFVEATGQADDVGRSYVLDADGIEARWVFFDNVTNWNGEAYTGLSEIRVEHLGAIAVPQTVTPTNATASSALPSALPGRLIDGSGLSGGSHGTDYRDMWLSNGVASPTLKLDLGQVHTITGMHVWNYNQVSGAALTGRGFCTADVYVSTTATGEGNPTDNPGNWTLVANALSFDQATGQADDAGSSYVLAPGGVAARWVFFDNVTNWDSGAYTGLSEVQFVEPI